MSAVLVSELKSMMMRVLFCAGMLSLGLIVGAQAQPRADAEGAGSATVSEPCSGEMDDDQVMKCLNQQGESAEAVLSKSYASNAKALDTACSEIFIRGQGACLERALQLADKKLNEAYALALKAIAKNDRPNFGPKLDWRGDLKRAQQAWLHFREADCNNLIGDEWRDGSGLGPATVACQLGHTLSRTAELHRRYDPRQ
ncbi:lysozyme inhibitor LprI family protein [Methylobacterium sp. UNC378MF]|uniref:lysozyme inhibitor LprI family protein n=1 Tax=Methylobacterium sp. UNC378MF TaxID=1502748 RepID=UPI000B885161|nr:lysozyme inhibitor LprI family protein [Methylobacterium sp. UNC378MF]